MQKPRFTSQPTRTERWGRRGTYGKGPRSLEPGLFCEFRAQAEQAPQRSRQRQSQCVLKHQGQWEEVQFNQHHRQDTARSQPPGLLCSFQTLLALCFLPVQGWVLSLMSMSRDGEGGGKKSCLLSPTELPSTALLPCEATNRVRSWAQSPNTPIHPFSLHADTASLGTEECDVPPSHWVRSCPQPLPTTGAPIPDTAQTPPAGLCPQGQGWGLRAPSPQWLRGV